MTYMRDPKRIPIILEKIEKLWIKHPDLRLGQLIENIASMNGCSVFYIEDEDLLQSIQEHSL